MPYALYRIGANATPPACDSAESNGATPTRRLHIGASFEDMTPASPFNEAAETVLHHGVSGGCRADRA